MIGWTEPTAPNPQKAVQWLKGLRHDVFLYPEECWDPEKPPSCIFVPDEPTLNKLIETVARNPGDQEKLNAKFGFMEYPRPQWMLDLDMEKAE